MTVGTWTPHCGALGGSRDLEMGTERVAVGTGTLCGWSLQQASCCSLEVTCGDDAMSGEWDAGWEVILQGLYSLLGLTVFERKRPALCNYGGPRAGVGTLQTWGRSGLCVFS